jgi:hypothetical protein
MFDIANIMELFGTFQINQNYFKKDIHSLLTCLLEPT